MTAIVGELLNMADDIEDGGVAVLLRKAADEIERLRAENDALKDALNDGWPIALQEKA